MTYPLEGIKVLELATHVAAPTAAKLLGDMGAEVIKIEGFGGDPRRQYTMPSPYFDYSKGENGRWENVNSGKKSICIDLKNPDGMALMHKLLSEVDVFITNVRLKALEKLGLDHDTVCKKYPSLIYGIVTSYGEKGPEAQNPGFDSSAFWARSGALADHVNKEAGRPAIPVTSSGDSVTGLALYSSLLTAIINKMKTGKGDYCETSLFGSAIWMYAVAIMDAVETQWEYPRPTTIGSPLWQIHKCKDERWILLTSKNSRLEMAPALDTLGLPELKELKGALNKPEYAEKYLPVINEAFMKKPSAEWIDEFTKQDIVCVPLKHFNEIPQDETALANNMLQEFTYPSGQKTIFVKPPINMQSLGGPQEYKLGPTVGGNTKEVLLSLGYSEADVEKLTAEGAIK